MTYKPTRRELLLTGAATAVAAIGTTIIKNTTRNPEPDYAWVKASLHNHSNFSGSSYLQDDTLDKMIPEAFSHGITILAITDSDQDKAFDELRKNHRALLGPDYRMDDLDNRILVIEHDKKPLFLMRGIEYHNSKDGHLIAIGYNNTLDAKKNQTYNPSDVCDRIHEMGGIMIAPHPMGIAEAFGTHKIGGLGEERLLVLKDKFDAIEIFNAQSLCFAPLVANAAKYNDQARAFAEKYKIPGIAVPDSHNYPDIGVSYFRMPTNMIDTSSGTAFVEGVQKAIRKTAESPENYEKMNHKEYESWFRFFGWAYWSNYGNITIGGASAVALAAGAGWLIKRRNKLRENRPQPDPKGVG